MNAFKTRATLTPDDFGRIGNQRRGGKLRHRRSYHLPCQQLPRETNQQGNKKPYRNAENSGQKHSLFTPSRLNSCQNRTSGAENLSLSPGLFNTTCRFLYAASSHPETNGEERASSPPSSSIRQTATVLSAGVPAERQCPWNPAHGSARREWARRKTPPPCSCSSRRPYPIHPSRY